jgi:hypothetical protein
MQYGPFKIGDRVPAGAPIIWNRLTGEFFVAVGDYPTPKPDSTLPIPAYAPLQRLGIDGRVESEPHLGLPVAAQAEPFPEL